MTSATFARLGVSNYDTTLCGRYTLSTPLTVLAKQFEFDLDCARQGGSTLS